MWKMEHTQEQFIVFLDFIDVLSHSARTRVEIPVMGRRARTPFITLLVIGYRALTTVISDVLLPTKWWWPLSRKMT